MTLHTRPRALLKFSAFGSASLAAVVALASCSSADADTPSDTLTVVTTTTQLTDFAQQIGGDDIELTGLLKPGGSAHHFDPTPADLLALGNADVLVVNGAGLDDFMDDAIEASGFSGEVVTAADGVHLDDDEAHSEEAHGHSDEAHSEDSHDHDHAEEEHDHEHADEEHDHDHDHGGVNPHIWTSPHNAVHMVEEITAGFVSADPDRADAYEQRSAEYIAQLEAVDAWAHDEFERVPEADRVIVSGHDSLHYYLDDYDIEFVGSILPSFDDNAEPSAAEIDALVTAIEEHGVPAIFVESSMSPRLAETIAREAGVRLVDEGTLYADSLAAPGEEAGTYIGATISNTRVILEAWGVEPGALPAILQE